VSRHDEVMRRFMSNRDVLSIGRRMLEIDSRFPRPEHADKRWEAYKRMNFSDDLLVELRSLLRNDTDVTFNCLDETIFTLASSPLNRVLALLLIVDRKISLRSGRPTIKPDPPGYLITYLDRHGVPVGQPERFDHVVTRHGPHKNFFRLALGNSPKEFVDACVALSGTAANLRLTEGLSPSTLYFFNGMK
jgi:hypothetical protein